MLAGNKLEKKAGNKVEKKAGNKLEKKAENKLEKKAENKLDEVAGDLRRCQWKNLESSQLYMEYHDEEWGVPSHQDAYLFEMFVLESFHCGLSWLLILKKREAFRRAFDGFDAEKIAEYDEQKVLELTEDKAIVRNKAKILATIDNAKAFLEVVREFGSFDKYLWGFTNEKVIYEPFDGVTTRNELSDVVSKDLKKRGFKFMGTVTCFSYLEAVGIMNNHAEYCCKYEKN